MQGLPVAEYERRKEEVADSIIARLERHLPGLKAATLFREVRRTVSKQRHRRCAGIQAVRSICLHGA